MNLTPSSSNPPCVSRTDFKVRAGPSGVHFFCRQTGLNVLCDEIRIPPELWAIAPRQVSIALTNACDLRCPYCYAPKTTAVLNRTILAGWFQELDANGCLAVGFGGGEPTLHEHFVWLCRYAAKQTNLAVTFTTHAHRIDSVLADALRGAVHFVRISMDGIGTTYEMLRGRPFAELHARLNIIRTIAPFGINFVVNADTMPDLNAALALAAEAGASEILLLPEYPTQGRHGIDPATARALQKWVSGYRSPLRLTISEASSDGMPAIPMVAGETGLRAYAHIDAQGILKRSSFDHAGIHIENSGVLDALLRLQNQEVESK